MRSRRGRVGAALTCSVLASLGSIAGAAVEPPDPELLCPEVEGFGAAYEPTASYARLEGIVPIFGSTMRFSSLSNAECSYSRPFDDTSPVDWASLAVYWAHDDTLDEHRARPCLLAETERDGIGVVTLAGSAAAYATYMVSAQEPVDTAPFEAAARALLDQVAPLASSCDGVTPPPEPSPELSPELPAFLAEAFSPLPTAGTPPDSTPPGESAAAPSDRGVVATVTPDESDGAGILGVLGAIATVVSLVLLAATFVVIRRETRIRPAFEVARVGLIAVIAVAGTLLLDGAASPPMVVAAIGAGLAIGIWQGSHLAVRAVAGGWSQRRTGWAIIAFATGIAVTQVAARVDHVAGLAVGLATAFLAAALAAGVIVGRLPRLRDVRRLTGITAMMLVAAAATGTPSSDPARAAVDDERATALEVLVDLVDWERVELRGGLFATEGKPPAEIAVPAALTTAPDPVTVSGSWNRDGGSGVVVYAVDESYTFGLREDGNCCTVGYEGAGTATAADGTVTSIEAAGQLDDIQSVALDGSPTSSFDSDLVGIPFGEVRSFLPTDADSAADAHSGITADTSSCGRPVGERRSTFDLRETGGEGTLTTFRVNGLDREPPRDLTQVTITTGCDLPGFTPADALAVAPPPPPVDDPARQGGCPVRQEVLDVLLPGSTLPGVDTTTTANAFLTPNRAACSDTVRLGQGGPGGTRHELMYTFARPTDPAFGDRSSLIDEIWWTDLPVATDIPAASQCGTDPDGRVSEPADPGHGCQHIDRYGLDDVRVFVWTDWQTWDGPNVIVFVTAPWGSYAYRCHYCTPNDPGIGAFLATVNQLGVDAAEQIADVTSTSGARPAEEPPAGDAADDGTADGDTVDDNLAVTTGATDAGSTAPVTDRSEPAAVAALLGLGGAVALLGLTLGEAGGWRASDPSGAGLGDERPAGSEALELLQNIQSFEEARAELEGRGYDPSIAAALAGLQVLGGNAAGDAAPFGGIGDNRLEQLSEALLPQGLRGALIPSEVVKNNLHAFLDAYEALTNSMGDSWYQGELDLTAFDAFGAALDERPTLDPFAGYHQAMGLLFDELLADGGRSLVLDAVNLTLDWYVGDRAPGVVDPSRVTVDDVVAALHESADSFRDEVASGAHGPVLQGLDSVFEITAEVTTDPVHALTEFVGDVVHIVRHGVGDGYWADVAEQVDGTLREVPVVQTIYVGYHELFSGVVSHATTVDDLHSGAAVAGFAGEMAEGAAALGAELVDFTTGGDHAVRAFDYLRSWF